MFWPCSFPLDIYGKIGIKNSEKKLSNRIFVSCEKKIGSVEDRFPLQVKWSIPKPCKNVDNIFVKGNC